MEQVRQIDEVEAYNRYVGAPSLHPLVNVIHFDELPPIRFINTRKLYGFYGIYLRDSKFSELHYGGSVYNYQSGSLVFVAPGQVMGSDADGCYHQVKGYLLIFHPDLLRGTLLDRQIRQYTFFSYTVNEALFLSASERSLVLECLTHIKSELETGDGESLTLAVDHLKLLLDYCTRFYNRQFSQYSQRNQDTLAHLESYLEQQLNKDLTDSGMPTVQECASALHLSPNYLNDLIRKETGLSALKHIHRKILEVAKSRIRNSNEPIYLIAEHLGFRYSSHFTRWFKLMEGESPERYRCK